MVIGDELQAIGIDLSTSFVHASYYNASSKFFSNIATISPPAPYHNFIWEIYQRHKTQQTEHVKAWHAFEKTRPYRNAVLGAKGVLERYRFTSWLAEYLPDVLRDGDFRYPFNKDLDIPLTREDTTWIRHLLGYVPSNFRSTASFDLDPPPKMPGPQLNNANFIKILTETLEQVKTAAFTNHAIKITSGVIAKPTWVNNQLDRLIMQACTNTDIQLLSQMDRPEAAMTLAKQNGSLHPLIIEQTGIGFSIHRESSSRSNDQLGAAFVPHLLLLELLKGKHFNRSEDGLTDSMYRLRHEIVKGRARLWYQDAPGLEMDVGSFRVIHNDTAGFRVLVRNFGEAAFTFNESISSAGLQDADSAYVCAVEDAIEQSLLHTDLVLDYLKHHSLINDTFEHEDWPTQYKTIRNTARNTSIPTHASWWDLVDEMLVLADFPDNLLILEGALRALRNVPSFTRTDAYPTEYMQHDLAARGAALDAAERLRQEDAYWLLGDDEEVIEWCENEEDTAHEEL